MKTIKFAGLFIILVLLQSCVITRPNYHMKLAGAEWATGEMTEPDVEKIAEEYAGSDAVFLLNEYIMEHFWTKGFTLSSNKDWSYHEIRRSKYIVLDPGVEDLTTITIYGKPSEYYLLVKNPGAPTRQYGIKDFKKSKTEYGGSKYTFVIPDVVRGTVIEEAEDSDVYMAFGLMGEKYLRFKYPCQWLNFELHVPQWWELSVKEISSMHPLDYFVTEDDSARTKMYKYTAVDIPPLKAEPFAPFPKEFAEYFKFQVDIFKMGQISYKGYKDWDDIAEDLNNYFTNMDYGTDTRRELRKICDRIIADSMTEFDKINAVLDYMHSEITINDKMESTGSFGKILKKKEANTNDFIGLTWRLMEQAELKADFFLSHSAESGYFDRAFIDPDEMSLFGILVRIDTVFYTILPYIKDYPITHVPEIAQGQPGFWISQAGLLLMTMPDGANSVTTYKEKYDVNVDDEGIISVVVDLNLDGILAYEMHNSVKDLEKEQLKEFFRQLVPFQTTDLDFKDYVYVKKESDFDDFSARLEYTIGNLVTVLPDEVIFQTGGLFNPISDNSKIPDFENRISPIKIHNRTTYKKEITIHYPQDWDLQQYPSPFKIENEFGIFHGEAVSNPGEIKLTEELNLAKTSQPKEKIGELAALLMGKSVLNLPSLIFKKSQASSE